MNLIIDRGNSQTKLYSFTGDDLKRSAKGPLPGKERSFNWTQWLEAEHIDGILISDVEGSFNDWEDLMKGHKTVTMSPDLSLPLYLRYKTPLTLGHDRIANGCGAWKLNPGRASLIIDCGTCLKMDIVGPEGEFLGGTISPGIRIRYQSLAQFTGKLPLIEPVVSEIPFRGDSTEGSIRSGVQNGLIAEIIAFRARYEEEYPELKVFLTGGDSEYFAASLKSPIFVAPDLTARGLNEILKLNLP